MGNNKKKKTNKTNKEKKHEQDHPTEPQQPPPDPLEFNVTGTSIGDRQCAKLSAHSHCSIS